jgi:hypothetical protein
MCLPLFHWRTTTGRSWSGVLKLHRCELSGVLIGRYVKICEKIPLSGGLLDKFIEIYATIAVDRQFGHKKRKLSGVKLGERAPQNRFLTAVAKPAA